MNEVTKNNLTINIDEMMNKLEPLLRRVVREELERVIEEKGNIFHLKPEMTLYQDMEEILQRQKEGKIELYSDEEVWNAFTLKSVNNC